MSPRSFAVAAASLFLIAAVSACAITSPPPNVGEDLSRPHMCFWLSNQGEGWVARPDLETELRCFEMDSCSGGLGQSGGGCYKWSTAADAPAAPWSRSAAKGAARAN